MTNPALEKFSADIDLVLEHNEVLAEKKSIEKTMEKIVSLINVEEKVIKSSGDSKDESGLGSLVSEFYDRYHDLYSRYVNLISKLQKNFHSKRETGSSSTAEEHIKNCEGQLASTDEPEAEVDSIRGGKNLASELAKREASPSELDSDSQMNFMVKLPGQEDLERKFNFLFQLQARTNETACTLMAHNENLRNELSMALKKLFTTQNCLQEYKKANELLSKEKLQLLEDNGELTDEVSTLEDKFRNLWEKCEQLQRKSEPLSTKDQIPELSLEHSEAVDEAQLQACEQVPISPTEFKSKFMNACKNLVISLQNINVITSNQLFAENRLFEDQFLGFCKNIVFSLTKIEVSDLQDETIRVLQKACQEQKIEMSRLEEGHKEMLEKIVACEATKEGDDKKIKELEEAEKRSAARDREKQEQDLEARRVLKEEMVELEKTVRENCRHIETTLSKSSKELQRVRKTMTAEKQELDQEAKRMQELMRELEKRLGEKEEGEKTLMREEMGELRKRVAEEEEKGRRVQEEARKRSVREIEKEGLILEQEEMMKELVERLREVEERMRELEEGGRRMERRAAHGMMALEEMEKSIDFKIVESRLLQEEMDERERKLGEKEEEMEERERKLGEREEVGRVRQEVMEEWEKRVREKEDEVRLMIDEKREAIRQLSEMIEYNRGQLGILMQYHCINFMSLCHALST